MCLILTAEDTRVILQRACFEGAPHTRQLFLSLNRAENKERSSTSAAARADTKTYVLFRSRAVKGAFHEGTKRWGGGRSARHYHFPPALRVPFKRWVMSLAAILRPPLTPLSFPDVLPTFLEEVNKRTTWTRSIIFRRPTCDVRVRPSNWRYPHGKCNDVDGKYTFTISYYIE